MADDLVKQPSGPGVIKVIEKEIKDEMEEKENDRGALDIIIEKVISRKFLVWMVASVLLAFSKIDADNWAAITLGYVGMQGFADIASKWKEAGK